MKTPREILLARHQAAETKLDQIRQTVVAAMTRREAAADEPAWRRELPLLAAAMVKLWQELVLPSRRTWASLAGVWLVILGFHLGNSVGPTAAASRPSAPVQELRTALERRHEWLAELAWLPSAELAKPPKHSLQPRSDLRGENTAA